MGRLPAALMHSYQQHSHFPLTQVHASRRPFSGTGCKLTKMFHAPHRMAGMMHGPCADVPEVHWIVLSMLGLEWLKGSIPLWHGGHQGKVSKWIAWTRLFDEKAPADDPHRPMRFSCCSIGSDVESLDQSLDRQAKAPHLGHSILGHPNVAASW